MVGTASGGVGVQPWGSNPCEHGGESGQTDLLDNCLKPRTEHVVLKAMVRIGRNSVILCSVRDLRLAPVLLTWGLCTPGGWSLRDFEDPPPNHTLNVHLGDLLVWRGVLTSYLLFIGTCPKHLRF